MIEDDPARQPALEFLDIALLGRAVDDDVEGIAAAGRHEVVDDPAIVVEQHRVTQAAVLEQLELTGEQRLERCVDPVAVKGQLAHVADIEQPGMLASPKVLGDHAFILHRHRVARERYHPRTARAVPRIERQGLNIGGVSLGHSVSLPKCGSNASSCKLPRPNPLLSLRPESFPHRKCVGGLPLRRPAPGREHFPDCPGTRGPFA